MRLYLVKIESTIPGYHNPPYKNNKMHTILIGGWHAFSEARGLYKKEEPETFGWMSEGDTFWYEDMRRALDATPGSRDFLSSLKPEESHICPLIDAVQDKISSGHSGASSSCLVSAYRGALRNWEAWVTATKHREILREYKKKQIDLISLNIFYNHLLYIGTPVVDEVGFKVAMERARVCFYDGNDKVEVAWDGGSVVSTITSLLQELRSMKADEDAKMKDQRFKERVEYLEFNYKHPVRWSWPGELDPRYSITAKEMAEMEKRHPGYRAHIELVSRRI
jgi:hypothetical protein